MGDTPDVELSYVNHRYEKSHREDGRRCHSWYLTDQFGTEHLAVVGIETDTMDGHYNYQALEPFASRMPLTCGNQSGVTKWLREWLAGNVGAGDGELPTYSGGAASSAGTVPGTGTGSGRRKAFTGSLCSSKVAILNAAGTSPISHYVAGGGGSGRGKKKAGAGNQTAMATYSSGVGGKQKPVGIVQQNQIKKARKIQDDIRAEHERLVVGHLSRLRRAAAAELQADSAAKQVTMAWLQGAPSSEELEALDHWRGLLSAVLDLQDQQRQQEAAAGAAGGCGSRGGGGGQQEGQQQRAVKQKGHGSSRLALAGMDGSGGDDQGQQEQQQRMAKQKGGGAAAGPVQEKLLLWLQQPDSRRHYLRVVLECLRELSAVEIPARVLMQHQLIALVQRCKCEHQHEAVRSLAEATLSRWRWQLAGHMQVLCEPTYMQDHAGVLEEEHAAGQVPLPTLPQYKQAVLDTPLPVLPGPGNRHAYTPAHSYQQHHVVHVHHHQHHLTQTASAPQLYDASAAAAAAGYAALQGFPGFTSAEGVTAGFEGAAAGFEGFNAANAAAAYYSPMAGLQSVQLGGSSPLSQLSGQQQQQQVMMYGPRSMGLCLPGPQQQQQQLLGADGGFAAAAGGGGGAGVGAMLAPGDAAAGLSAMPAGWQQAAAAGAAAAAADAAGSSLYMYGMQVPSSASPAAYGAMMGEQQAGAMSMQQQPQLL